MAELHGRVKNDETKLASERAQHNATAKDLVQAHEQVLELKRRTRVAVSLAVAIRSSMRLLMNAHRRQFTASMTLGCAPSAGCDGPESCTSCLLNAADMHTLAPSVFFSSAFAVLCVTRDACRHCCAGV